MLSQRIAHLYIEDFQQKAAAERVAGGVRLEGTHMEAQRAKLCAAIWQRTSITFREAHPALQPCNASFKDGGFAW